MNLKLTVHFQKRMADRNIDLEHVKKALKKPDYKEGVNDGKIKVRKKINKKVIEVIYCKDGFRDTSDTYIVITAYYLKK